MAALLDAGFEVPEPLRDDPSNLWRTKYYDQIAFMGRNEELRLGDSEPNAGVFDPFKSVFRTRDAKKYFEYMPESETAGKSEAELKEYFKRTWRTFQISDHLLMWMELKVDFSDDYLQRLEDDARA